jgi:photoactive yellow protein
MNSSATTVTFDGEKMCEQLNAMSPAELDALPFGVIGFDAAGHVQRYNAREAAMAFFKAEEVIGQHIFVELAPCMNNYLIAGRFEEAAEQGQPLDESMPYVLTFRMRPTRAMLRMVASPDHPLRFLLIQRQQGAGA